MGQTVARRTQANTIKWTGVLLLVACAFGSSSAWAAAVDTTAPLAPKMSPPPSPNNGANTLFAKFVVSEIGGVVECKMDDEAWRTDMCAPLASAYPVAPGFPKPDGKTGIYGVGYIAEGIHTLYIRQIDAAGNVGPTASTSWVTDKTAPEKPILSGFPTGPTNKTIPITISITNPEKGSVYSFSVDGGTTWTAYSNKTANYVFSKQVHGTGYRIQARQKDAAGNISEISEEAVWMIDAKAPPAPVVKVPWSPTSQTEHQEIEYTLKESYDWAGPPRVQCSLDNSAWVDCKSNDSNDSGMFTSGKLSEGKHTLLVRQIDAAGNISASGSTTWIVDTTGPVAPVITQITTPAPSRDAVVKFALNESSYMMPQCKIDQEQWGECNLISRPNGPIKAASIQFKDLEEGLHSISIRQYDIAGNMGQAKTMNWVVDTYGPMPPEVEDLAAFTSKKQQTIHFAMDESGGKLLCNLDNKAWVACTSVSGTTGTFVTAALADGLHTLKVRQIDAAGNYIPEGWGENPRGIRTWTVDTKAPAAANFSATPAYTNQDKYNLILFDLGELNSTVSCNFNNEGWADCTPPAPISDPPPGAPPATMAAVWHEHLDAGVYPLQVKQTDRAGNISPVSSFNLTVDVTAPAVPAIASGPAQGSTAKGAATIFVFTGEAAASFQCSLDEADFIKCVTPKKLTGLAAGMHTLKVKQLDRAGNESEIVARSWINIP